jgi:hypothetical protein
MCVVSHQESAMSNALPAAKQPSTKSSFLGWPLATVLLAMVLIVGVPVAYVVMTWSHAVTSGPERLVNSLSAAAAEAVRPKVSINEIVVSSVADLRKESKLVVFSAKVNADVTQVETASSWGIYWGTNTARVIARDAGAPYVIDLSKLNTSDFVYNDEAKVLSLYVPRPKMDTDMVSIDPAKIQTVDLSGGWLRWDKQTTRDHALSEIKTNVVKQANAPYIRQLADAAGIESTTKLLQPMAETLAREGVTVKVNYRE